MDGMQNVEDIYPLTSMQELMVLRLLAGGESSALMEQVPMTFRGDLDVESFQAAWQVVVDRHTILRTAFLTEGLKQPVQVVRKEARPEWCVEDWRDRDDSERALEAWLREDEARGFDATQAPLLRFALFRVADDRFHFVQSMHHVLLDRWSAMQVFGEALQVYEGLRAGQAVDLPTARPYSEFVGWLQSQEDSEAEAHWRKLLAGFQGTTPLPYSEASTEREAGAAESRSRELGPERAAALRQAARTMRVTQSTVLRGAFGLVLGAAARERDVVFGVTVSGRPAELEGVEEIVGMFINNLPARVIVEPDLPVGEWLRGVQTSDVQTRRFEHTPLAYVEDWAGTGRSGPLFESLLVFQNDPVRESPEGAPPPSLEVLEARGEMRTAYALTLSVSPTGNYGLQLTYDSARFDAAVIDALLDALVQVLEQIGAAPDALVSSLSEALVGLEPFAVDPEQPRSHAGPIVLAADEFVAPTTPTEIALARVWADVLGVEKVGLRDNFFDLGGTSLLAIRTIGRLQKEAGIQPGAASFVTQNLGQLAAALEGGASRGGAAGAKGGLLSKLLPKWGRRKG